jgi:hypothetical protein
MIGEFSLFIAQLNIEQVQTGFVQWAMSLHICIIAVTTVLDHLSNVTAGLPHARAGHEALRVPRQRQL